MRVWLADWLERWAWRLRFGGRYRVIGDFGVFLAIDKVGMDLDSIPRLRDIR